MNTRITSIENLIAYDPGGRNVFDLHLADQLRLAAQSLRLARRVAIVSGFFVKQAHAGETDGPPGAKVLGAALSELGIEVDHITDERNAPLYRALGLEPICDPEGYLERARPTHLVAIERGGRGVDGRYRNMRGDDITDVTAPLDQLFLDATMRGLSTIGIGDGGNEIGMGKVFADTIEAVENGAMIATTVSTDFCIAAGVSNWGAFGLAGALSVLAERDLLPSAREVAEDIDRIVLQGGAVDGVTYRREATCDGLPLEATLRMLESVRRQTVPSPLERGEPLLVGVLGFGESGQAAAKLLRKHGHRIRISDKEPVTVPHDMVVEGVEVGKHSIEFVGGCDMVVVSPGMPIESPIIDALHARGVPIVSELELAYQLGSGDDSSAGPMMVAVTGTIGKRSTVELMQHFFDACGLPLTIGGNRGKPLSALLLPEPPPERIALAVSSFQLESVVRFRSHIAVLLNLDEQHLDRHRSLAEYARIKSRVFMNHGPEDVLILPFDDPRLRSLARKNRGRTLFVSADRAVDRGAWVEGAQVYLNVEGESVCLGRTTAIYPINLLVSVLTARLLGVDPVRLRNVLGKLGAQDHGSVATR